MCVEMETWRDGKEMNNELHLQLHCIYTNDNEKAIYLSSVLLPFPVYGQHIFSTFSTFPVVPAWCFANGMTTQCCQPWESRVCVCACRKTQCLHETFFDLLNLFRPFWEMFRKRHDNTVIHPSSHGQLYVACSRVGNPTNTYIPAPEGKTKNFSDISNRR